MACDAPTFFLLLETGSFLLQEDGASRVVLELATVPGVFVCGTFIPSGAQLFPPVVTQSAPVPGAKACEEPALPELVGVPTVASVRRPARGSDLVTATPHTPPTIVTPPAAATPPARTTQRVCSGASSFPIKR